MFGNLNRKIIFSTGQIITYTKNQTISTLTEYNSNNIPDDYT